MYVVWSDERDGASDIYFDASLNGGLEWFAADRRLDTGGAGSSHSERPRIVSYDDNVYVVWQDDRFDSTTEVMFARDLTGLGSWEAEGFLTSTVPVPHFFFEPTVSIDFFTNEAPPLHSAANVAFHDGSLLHYLRSLDSGATFSPSGALPPAPAAPISSADSPRLSRLQRTRASYQYSNPGRMSKC